jgi:hypothetical protein
MASGTAVNPTEQPRELCRFDFYIKFLKFTYLLIDISFPMFVVMVINVFIHTIDRMDKSIMSVDFICKENVPMVRDAGMKYIIFIRLITFIDSRYDHVRPKPQQPTSIRSNPPLQQNFINTKSQSINERGIHSNLSFVFCL